MLGAAEDEFRKQHFEDEQVADLVDVSMKLEGFINHASTHTAGLVIGDRPWPNLCRSIVTWVNMPVTQFNMKWWKRLVWSNLIFWD